MTRESGAGERSKTYPQDALGFTSCLQYFLKTPAHHFLSRTTNLGLLRKILFKFRAKILEVGSGALKDLFHHTLGSLSVISCIVLLWIEKNVQQNRCLNCARLIVVCGLRQRGDGRPSSFGVLGFVEIIRSHTQGRGATSFEVGADPI